MNNFSIFPGMALRARSRKLLMLTAAASLMTALSVSPAFAEKNGNPGRGNPHVGQGHMSSQHGDRDGRRNREWHGRQGYRYQPMYHPPYGYAQPVYVPPPAYYEPRQSPGISLFFPLDLRR